MAEKQQYLGIQIDDSRDSLFEDHSKYLIKQHYADENETLQQALARPSVCWSSNPAHAQRLYDYASQGWFMFASPVFSNAVLPGEKPKNLPISCFLPMVGDSVPDLLFQKAEFALLSVMGGGVGQDWSSVRPVSKKAPGPIPFIHENDGGILAWKQGSTRRGAIAAHLDIQHPDTQEFLKIRVPTGDSDRKSLNIHHGYNIPDSFMQAVINGDTIYPLTNPATGKQEGEVNPRQHFTDTIDIRGRTGEPFMYFIDTANRFLPLPQRMLGLKCHATNICTEITLAASKDRTPVCCLSSLNAEKLPEYEHILDQVVSDLVEMLDNVLTFFIDNIDYIAERYEHELDKQLIKLILTKVKNSAQAERSIGLGVMGWHYLLQRLNIPYESQEAIDLNVSLFDRIKDYAHSVSCRLGIERGVPPDIQNYIKLCEEKGIDVDPYWVNRRNLHLLCLAPNSNNAVILSTSPSAETVFANLYSQEMRIGSITIKNRYLEKVLEKYGKNDKATWDKIADDGGSAKNLTFLTDRERAVYKTAMEIDQFWVVEHYATRQPFICQAQSFNMYLGPGTDINYAVGLHIYAWKRGLKSIYYYRTETGAKVERVSTKVEQDRIEEDKRTIVYGTPTCTQCKAAKALLEANGIEYEYIDLVDLGKTAAEVTGRPVRSVPQIYIESQYIGGLTELMVYLNKNKEDTSDGACVSCEA